MDKILELLNPAIISLVVTSIIAPLIFYYLKKKDENKKRNFDVRYAEYKKYMTTLENISTLSRNKFENDFMKVAKECFTDIITKPEESNKALIKLNTTLQDLTSNIRIAFTQSKNELHGLKLICSEKLFDLINEFISIQSELINKSTEFMNRWQEYIGKEQSIFENSDIQKLGMKANSLYEEILKQMRKELKIT